MIGSSFRLAAVTAAALAFAASTHAQQRPPRATPIPGKDPPAEVQALLDAAAATNARGDLAAAIAQAEGAWARADITLGHDSLGTADALDLLGWLYTLAERFEDAERVLQRAVDLREQHLGAEAVPTLRARMRLAELYRRQGRLREAEGLSLANLAVMEGRTDAAGLRIAAMSNLAAVYFGQGRLHDAETFLRRALEASEQLNGPEHEATLVIASNLAEERRRQGDVAEQERLLRRVTEARRRTLGPEAVPTLDSLGSLATFLVEQRRFDEAQTVLVPLTTTAERLWGAADRRVLNLRKLLGDLRSAQGRDSEAEQIFADVLARSRDAYGEEHMFTLTAASRLALSRMRISGGAPAALEPARMVMAALAKRRGFAGDMEDTEQSRRDAALLARFAATMPEVDWVAQQAPGADHDSLIAEAFEAMQEATSGTASEAVVRTAARNLAERQDPALGALVRQRDDLEAQWRATAHRYSAALTAPDGPETAAQRQQLVWERLRYNSQIVAIDQRLASEFGQYFDLVRPRPVSLADTRALLADGEALLIIVPGPLATHVVYVGAHGVFQERSPLTAAQLDRHVRRLLWDVGANVTVSPEEADRWGREAGPGYSFDRRTAYLLYQQLFEPLGEQLRGTRHLYIVAGGSLSSLPFGMLVTEAPAGSDASPQALRATRWLADKYALVQMPSVQSLQFLRRYHGTAGNGAAPTQPLVGFGDPALQGAAEQRGRARGGQGVGRLPAASAARDAASGTVVAQLRLMNRLPGTATELEEIRQALGAAPDSLFTGSRATERTLRTMDLSHARIIALATHGLLGGEIAGLPEPGLVMTPPQTPDQGDDGYVTASEVSALRLNADWVILSACNTAAGDGSAGAPGLSGLARAFFFAGARNILASHWPVRDAVAPRLTVRTIELMRQNSGMSRAEALQQAMREVRNDASHDTAEDSWAHPSAWAPFVLIGEAAR